MEDPHLPTPKEIFDRFSEAVKSENLEAIHPFLVDKAYEKPLALARVS